MPPEPIGEICLCDTNTSDAFHSPDCVQRVEVKALAVVCQKQTRSDPCCPFVAVDEAVVVGEAIGIRCGQVGCIRITIHREVQRACEGGFDHLEVTDPVRPAVLGELTVMDGQDDAEINPAPLAQIVVTHFASARSTSRSSCMMSSASAIWRANSGS